MPLNKPKFVFENVNVNYYNESGIIAYNVSAESGTQYPSDSLIYLSYIKLHVADESNIYKVSSKNGWINPKNSQALLKEDVDIKRMDGKALPILLHSSNVFIEKNAEYISSKDKTSILQGKNTIKSNGFQLDYEKEIFQLESGVEVVYYNNSSSH